MTTNDKTWESLKADYLRQIDKSLKAAGNQSTEGILEDIGAHLDQRYQELPPEQRNWDGYQATITAMGPPSDYADLLGIAKLKRRIVTWRRVVIGLPLVLLLLLIVFVWGVQRGTIPLGVYHGPRIYPLPNRPIEGEFIPDSQLVGHWTSVDFVDLSAEFTPGEKSWSGNLWLTELEFRDAGQVLAAVASSDTAGAGHSLRPWSQYSWTKGWLFDGPAGIRAQYEIREIGADLYLFFPWLSGDVTLRSMRPSYYVLKKTSDAGPSAPAVTKLSSVSEFDDVRGKDLSDLNFSARTGLVATLQFNAQTVWPKTLPAGEEPQQILTAAMNPGLGVRALHNEGITGKGVNVAIIDQPLCQDHPEFAGKIAAYFDTGCGSESSMHGPAVVSLLVGEKCGTAPGTRLYYAAVPSWLADSAYYAKAMDWILEQNASLPPGQKIRAVSVSAAPSGQGSPFKKNTEMWDDACRRATDAGILVLDCTSENGFIGPCRYMPAAPEDVTRCMAGFPGRGLSRASGYLSAHVLVPCSNRTTAEQYTPHEPSYAYWGSGGLSWSIPYATGVLAMGWQIAPELTGKEMKQLLFDSADVNAGGQKFITPPKFMELVKRHKKS